jgi:large subunit ribosomal protein L25
MQEEFKMEGLILHKRNKNTVHQAKKQRRFGKVPGIIYGRNMHNLMFEIGELELNKEINYKGEHSVLDVEFEEGRYKTLVKEIQRDAVNHKIIHVDLEEIPENETIQTDISIIFKGEDLIMRKGGIVQKEKTDIKIQCKGEDIPNHINVDLSTLEIGDSYRISDVEFSKEIVFIDDLNTVIAFVTSNNKPEEDALEGSPEL